MTASVYDMLLGCRGELTLLVLLLMKGQMVCPAIVTESVPTMHSLDCQQLPETKRGC